MTALQDIEGRAEQLVFAARAAATPMIIPVENCFPTLRGLDMDHWTFVVTIAGVFLALTRLRALDVEETIRESVENTVIARLNEWDNRAGYGFEDCKALYERTYDLLLDIGVDQEWVASDALGMWIAGNTLDRRPSSQDEVHTARMLGALVTHGFFDWWTG